MRGDRLDKIVDVVLAAIGETPDLIETTRLFSLLGLIAPKLSPDDALDALTFGMDLSNSALEDKDGDGPWKNEFLTASSNSGSVGRLWSHQMDAPTR